MENQQIISGYDVLRSTGASFQIEFAGMALIDALDQYHDTKHYSHPFNQVIKATFEVLSKAQMTSDVFHVGCGLKLFAGREGGEVIYIQLIQAYYKADVESIYGAIAKRLNADEVGVYNGRLRLWFDAFWL